jgi:cyclohexanecarboxylate-CoA ligase
MIPVADVEVELLTHPAIADVALVGYPDGTSGERACAVLVTHADPPTLAEIRAYLTDRGMTDWYQPSRLAIVTELPRTATGKVRTYLLRAQLGQHP